MSFDWPGFGDSDRPALTYDAALLRSSLDAVLTDLAGCHPGPITVVAAGHSAPLALALASAWSERWSRFVEVAPTWRGPLPTMTGWSPGRFGWLRRHVWLDPGLLTPDRLGEQQRLAQSADVVMRLPGRLGLHQEFGALLERRLLEVEAPMG